MPTARNRKTTPRLARHAPTGQARVRLKDATTGRNRDIYCGIYGSVEAHKRYAEVVEAWEAAGRTFDGLPEHQRRGTGQVEGDPPPSATVAELCLDYWKQVKTRYDISDDAKKIPSEPAWQRTILRRLRSVAGKMPAADFGPKTLAEVRQTFVDAGWKRTTCNRATRLIVRVFKRGVAMEAIPPTVVQGLQCLEPLKHGEAPESARVVPVPEADIDAIRPHLSSVIEAMVDLQLLTGMRPGEVCSMRGIDIDVTGDVWVYRPPRHKNSHRGIDRSVCLGPRARRIVEDFLKPDTSAHLFSPRDAKAEHMQRRHDARKTPLSCGNKPKGNRPTPQARVRDAYDSGTYARAIRDACRAAEIEVWGPARLRHNAASNLRRKYGAEAVPLMLGHAGPGLVETYAERDQQQALKIASEVG